ncbi:MAG: hypothetical protein LBE25_14955 [Arthrobacter sp.]|jgi:hypothetical protein|nr:hypothetical protein [Arthrobacter sp.]
MRFDDLFADLEAQAAALAQRELWDEAHSLARAELGRLELGDRLLGAAAWRLRLAGGHGCAGRLARVEADCLVVDRPASQWCVPLAAVRSATPLGTGRQVPVAAQGSAQVAAQGAAPGTQPPGARQAERGSTTLRALLRRASRHRPLLRVLLDDGSACCGRLVQVGLDHAELRGDEGVLLVGLGGVSAWELGPHPAEGAA